MARRAIRAGTGSRIDATAAKIFGTGWRTGATGAKTTGTAARTGAIAARTGGTAGRTGGTGITTGAAATGWRTAATGARTWPIAAKTGATGAKTWPIAAKINATAARIDATGAAELLRGKGGAAREANGSYLPRMARFELVTDLSPLGDQPAAIRELTDGLAAGRRFQTLLGATGTGKTFTIGHVIRNYGRPTLVMSHNKTLAAQLYGELKQLFPNNAVEYFISYYDYYQPEAYIPATDTYIEKDASINEDIDRLRLRTTSSLIEREDVIVVASVSAIYGLGSPREYRELMVVVEKGQSAPREQILEELVRIQYRRDDIGFEPGKF